MTRPQQSRPGHPLWCVKDGESTIGRHVSAVLQAGERREGGAASVWLTVMNGGRPRVHMSVAQMAWAVIDLPLEDAARVRDNLTALLVAAGYEQPAYPETP
jgi:hypothetical protein